MKTYTFPLAALILLLCVACRAAGPEITSSPLPIPTETLVPTPAPTPAPTPESPPDIALGFWESNSFRLSDGLTYQFKDDGTYESWHLNGAFAPSGRYTYEDWILVLQDNTGHETDRLYYVLETGQFVSTMTEHAVDQEHVDNNGVLIPAQFEPTTLTYHNEPNAPNPYEGIVPSTVSVDISDPAVYRSLNIFLSNFSECNFPSFSTENPDYGEIADFAFMHAWINSPSVIEEYGKYFPVYDDYDIATTCVSVSYIEKVARRFFAGEVDRSAIDAAWKNGHGQGVITNGACGVGFTLVDSVTDLGENCFEVQFHIYTVPGADYPTYDSSSGSAIYSAYPDNFPKPPYVPDQPPFVGTPGSAIVEAVQKEDGSLAFLLHTYTVNKK